MEIAGYRFPNALALAPMAGVTDRVFRRVCRGFGASVTVGEMVSARSELRDTRKSRLRLDFSGEPAPRIIQIAGGDAADLAAAARVNADAGADIIDINMGCPAKKVCRKAAGSALMADIDHVGRILDAVVAASPVPVTLKMRTGVSADRINAVAIAKMAERAGIAALAVHGRTRDQHYRGVAEYDTIAAVVAAVSIPVWANGDVDSVARAREVRAATGAAGLMIGRAACRRPWLFRQIAAAAEGRPPVAEPGLADEAEIVLGLVEQVHDFYGEEQGVRVARKHIGWLCERRAPHPALYMDLMTAATAARQIRLLDRYFDAVNLAA
ncbi:tRNA dihydrouridine synthase DusB [Salinisphaera hydrothermalis]|uniref:tRNA-dihydrouridine synthase n=1 Tax=Salinisphaera hydrothermalis (strain C41B8) TaxID=1304275 RepID=A0A084IJB3_SALHC|nr:tRNA dihydrouridine synthase DusB [Salinisphaera hydrothermalis]KEZ76797.1 NifR3 family TIM-barrel protein [Salinisphaera hydrothermalis C41B8]